MNITNQSNVTYNAVVPNQAGTPGELASNNVNTEILSYSISKVLRADKTSAKEGETVHNTVTVTNNSTTRLVYTFISNPTPEGATYVAASVKVNGVTQPIYDPVKGFPLPELNPGDTVAIEYTIKPNEELSINTYSDILKVIMELIRAGIPVECSTSVNTATRRLVASINIESPQIASLVSRWNELNKELESEKIDSDEYNIWIDSLMNSFNIPVENY